MAPQKPGLHSAGIFLRETGNANRVVMASTSKSPRGSKSPQGSKSPGGSPSPQGGKSPQGSRSPRGSKSPQGSKSPLSPRSPAPPRSPHSRSPQSQASSDEPGPIQPVSLFRGPIKSRSLLPFYSQTYNARIPRSKILLKTISRQTSASFSMGDWD